MSFFLNFSRRYDSLLLRPFSSPFPSSILSNLIHKPQIRTATKRAGGSTKNNRGSAGRRLGVKKFGGEAVKEGDIIIRQRGQRFHPGQDVYLGKDHTLHARIPGFVKFYTDPTGESVGYRALSLRRQRMRKFVGVVREKNESLPRDLGSCGRSRYFDLVDLAERQRKLKTVQYRITNSSLLGPSSDAVKLKSTGS